MTFTRTAGAKSVLSPRLSGKLAPSKGGGDVIASIFADGTDGFYYNFSSLSTLWQDTTATSPVTAAGDSIARVNDSSPRGRNATQATSAARPKYQTGGLSRYDGVDDNLLTTQVPGTTMTVLVKAKLSTGGSIRLMMSSVDTGAINRLQLQTNASDAIECRIGSGSALSGTGTSRLGTVFVAGLQFDGTTVSLIENGIITAQAAQSGVPSSSTAIVLGAFNNGGSFSNFWFGDIYYALAIKKALTAAQIAAITNKWGTS